MTAEKRTVRVKPHLETALQEIKDDMVYGQSMTDPEYLREMARLCDENVGPPVREHSNRLRAIASRIEALSRAFEAVTK